jgi:hypothetical protein
MLEVATRGSASSPFLFGVVTTGIDSRWPATPGSEMTY